MYLVKIIFQSGHLLYFQMSVTTTSLKRKLRSSVLFLHPDKLPKDLTPDQFFMVRMLWDITSDALEVLKNQKEELNWIHQ